MNEISKWYDEYADRQVAVGINKRHESIQNWLLKFGLKKNDRVLEIGCGVGTQTELLLDYLGSAGHVKAIDISERSIEIAKKRCARFKNVEFDSVNILETDLNDKFDLILLPDVIEHIPLELHGTLFKKLKGHLNNSGKVVIHIPQPYYQEWCKVNCPEKLQILDQAVHMHEISMNAFKADLQIVYSETYSIWMNPGEYQIVCLKPKEVINYSAKVSKPGIVQRGMYKLKNLTTNK